MYNKHILKKLDTWRQSPLLFVTECIQATPSNQQAELLASFGKNKRTTVRSGHGTGKSTCAAWLIIWFMSTRPYAKVVCTAPTAHQLYDILWSELSKWLRKSVLADEYVIQKDKMFQKDAPKEWWTRAVTTSAKASREDQAETLAGFHGDHLLIIVEESSGVVDPIFIPLEGALSQEDNMCLLIGNMTKNKGYFYDTHFHPEISKSWKKFHWDARKSSNVTKDQIDYFINKYGVDSNVFRIRVAGEPPLADDKVFIPLAWAEQCIGNDIVMPEDEPLYVSSDIARYGDDSSIILPRIGNIINPWEVYNKLNIITLAGFIMQYCNEVNAEGCAIDEIGVGAGVYDWLEKHNMRNLYGINSTLESPDVRRANKLRDWLWMQVREKCQNAQYSFPELKRPNDVESLGQQLANELSSPYYDFNAYGGFVIESKRKMKERGVMSPNIADSLANSEYFYGASTQLFRKPKKQTREMRNPAIYGNNYNSRGSNSWMAN